MANPAPNSWRPGRKAGGKTLTTALRAMPKEARLRFLVLLCRRLARDRRDDRQAEREVGAGEGEGEGERRKG